MFCGGIDQHGSSDSFRRHTAQCRNRSASSSRATTGTSPSPIVSTKCSIAVVSAYVQRYVPEGVHSGRHTATLRARDVTLETPCEDLVNDAVAVGGPCRTVKKAIVTLFFAVSVKHICQHAQNIIFYMAMVKRKRADGKLLDNSSFCERIFQYQNCFLEKNEEAWNALLSYPPDHRGLPEYQPFWVGY